MRVISFFRQARMGMLLLLAGLLPALAWAQASASYAQLINERVGPYPLSTDNFFRLAAYTELKGNYDPDSEVLRLPFGAAGYLMFYPAHCLLRTGNRVYTLDRDDQHPARIEALNEALAALLERIALLSNGPARPEVVAFVDEALRRKNIEPFDKLFLRYLLLHHGQFDPQAQAMSFHSEWLPVDSIDWAEHGRLTRRPAAPLRVKLTPDLVRGYYVRSGGTVFVEEVETTLAYVTGESYEYHVAAFKLFIQRLLTQHTQYVVGQQPRLSLRGASRGADEGAGQVAKAQAATVWLQPGRGSAAEGTLLYHPQQWIPMMLGLLRNAGTDVTDREIMCYLLPHPQFALIYAYLTPEEKAAYDRARSLQPEKE
jgi:hypothetical protein